MGERLLCKQEVVGSIPSGSTRSAIDRARRRLDVACARTGLAHDWARVNSAGRKRSARALDGPFCSSRSLKRFARVRVRPSVRVLFDIVKRRSLRARLDENRGRFAFSMYGFAGPPHRKMPRVADCATCRRRLTARAVGRSLSKLVFLINVRSMPMFSRHHVSRHRVLRHHVDRRAERMGIDNENDQVS